MILLKHLQYDEFAFGIDFWQMSCPFVFTAPQSPSDFFWFCLWSKVQTKDVASKTSLQALKLRWYLNSAVSLSHGLTGVNCRTSSVAKKNRPAQVLYALQVSRGVLFC